MDFRKNTDRLMSQVKVNEKLHQAIMEGSSMKNRGKFTLKWAAGSAAAALLATSTLYAGAGYVIGHASLREIFMAREDSALTVPKTQQMPDIYGEILDSRLPAAEADAADLPTVPLGNSGEMIIDNDLFSIELLETACAGRELFLSYILTQKTDQNICVTVHVNTAENAQWQDGTTRDDLSQNRLDFGFGDYFDWDRLPESCGYELAENQQLHTFTQLWKEDCATGTYILEANYVIYEDILPDIPVAEEPDPPSDITLLAGGAPLEEGSFKAPLEIVGNENYGLALSGVTDKTEKNVHFDSYEVYVSPLTVYLTLEGTYNEEMSFVWGFNSSHEIVVGFRDGTMTQATVRLSSMHYGSGAIEVGMNVSFDIPIDPEAITEVTLDGEEIFSRN